MRVEFELLGHVRAHLDGAEVDVGPAQRQAVLVALLMSASPDVPMERLAFRVWQDQPPPGSAGALRAHISRLRRAFRGAVRIDRGRLGYVVHADESAIDVSIFRDLVARARATEDDVLAAELFSEAMTLWRDEPFAGLQGEWIERTRSALQREHHAARLDQNDVELRLGHHTALASSLAEEVAAHPLDERLRAQYLLALYRSGRPAEVLRQYEDIRVSLADELGVDPGPALRDLHQQALSAASGLRHAAAGGFGCHLPAAIPDFVGRKEEIAELTSAPLRLAVISGPAGTGKSTLAVTAAHRLCARFPDGQLYVRASSPSEALGALLLQCGVLSSDLPAGRTARTAMLRGKLTGRKVLVVIDDLHEAGQMTDVIPGTPDCAVLITSRSLLAATPVRLRIRLQPLRESESVELLTHLVGPRRAAAEPVALRDIAAACGHLPLALRIAGARLTAMPAAPLAALAERLHNHHTRLDELDIGVASVRTSIDFSYTRLCEDDQTAMRWLGTLPVNGFTEWQLSALSGRRDVSRTLERLCDAGLINSNGPGPSGEQEFRMHELLGDFVREQARQLPPDVRRAGLRRLLCAVTRNAAATQRPMHGRTRFGRELFGFLAAATEVPSRHAEAG